MNHAVTSKEMILQASRDLVREKGWEAVSIRSVAAACGVATGSIYNYFDSKSDLVAATVESVWHDIFHMQEKEPLFHSFTDCIEWIYESIKRGEQKYPGFFSLHAVSFLGEDMAKGKSTMQRSWLHIKEQLCRVLLRDEQVRPDAFHAQFTPEAFTELIFSLLIASLLRQEYDSCAVLEVIRRSIY